MSQTQQTAPVIDQASAPSAADPLLISFLARDDVPCPVCTYSLRNLATASCPECNAPLNLAVASENAALGPWTLAVVAIAMGAGFDGVVCLIMSTMLTIASIFGGEILPWPPFVIAATLLTLTLLGIGFIVLMVRKRRRWMRHPRRRQWRWAVGIFIAVFVLHASVGVLFFNLLQLI